MFTCWHSSPTSPTVRITCQTTLDAHRHPKPQTDKKDSDIRPHSAAKEKGKDIERDPRQDSLSATEDGPSSVGEAKVEADDSLQITVCDVDQGRCFLEDEQLIETDMELSVNDLMEALISISMLCDMPSLTRNAVRSRS